MSSNQTTKVVTGKVRLSYCHIFEPFTNLPGQEAKYSCVLLIPKSDKTTLDKMKAAQQAALENGKAKAFNGKIPANWHSTIKDGDNPEQTDLERNPEYAGHFYLSVNSKTRPGIVDGNLNAILDSTAVYSGCYVRASLNAYAYNTQGNKGVTFGLNHIQLMADGEFLGGRSRAEDDFDALDSSDNLL
jgi:hypothetical protein